MRIVVTFAVGLMLVALVVAASLALSPGTQSTTPITTDALGVDAQSYASDYGVTVEEARSRLILQGSVGPVQKDLIDNESATFAGLWIQHEPVYRIIARFTRDGEATIGPYVTSGPLTGLVDVRTADATLNDLKAAQNGAMTKARGVGVPVESEIDVIGNRVKLFVVDKAGLESALTEAGEQLPNKVDVVKVDELSRATTDLYGGLTIRNITGNEVRFCTTGFSVTHSDGREGITTAAHCRENQTYNGTALDFVEGRLGGKYDVQWHEAPGFTMRGLMKVGQNLSRHVRSTRIRDLQTVGEYVCKYGHSTQFGCGNIETKTFQPTDQTGCSSGCTFEPTFIRVHSNSGDDLANGGDSGGPWFSGNTAYGVMRSELGNDAIYMAINYVYVLGVSVITEE